MLTPYRKFDILAAQKSLNASQYCLEEYASIMQKTSIAIQIQEWAPVIPTTTTIITSHRFCTSSTTIGFANPPPSITNYSMENTPITSRKEKERRRRSTRTEYDYNGGRGRRGADNYYGGASSLAGERIDEVSAKLFPLLFTAFNIFYWFYYIGMSGGIF